MDRIRFGIGLAAVLVAVVAGAAISGTQPVDPGQTQVVASFYPFYDITGEVAGDAAAVDSLVPPGTEPHGYEPAPSTMTAVHGADAFVATGVEFEAWEEQVLSGAPDSVQVINASDGIRLLPADHGADHGGHGGAGHDDGPHGMHDPHYWVSPVNAITITENVRDGLVAADPANAAAYEENAAAFIQELEELDARYEQQLSDCEQDRVLTTHAAFTYLGDAYGFEQVPIHGVSPLSEPTPGQLERINQAVAEHDIDYIFYEEMVDSRVAETIAAETGAEVLILNPVSGSAADEGYVSIMEENLEQLTTALECR